MAHEMHSVFILLTLLWGAGGHSNSRPWLARFNATASSGAVVTLGPARFTVLTPHVVRMEYHPTSAWDDRATVNIVHRATTIPTFTTERSVEADGSASLTITTAVLVLRFIDDGGVAGGFSPESLSVTVLDMSPPVVWAPGTLPRGNLHGTLRTLDRVGDAVDLTCLTPRDAMTYYAHCEEGLVSRDGWVIMDDSLRPRFHAHPPGAHHLSDPEWPWAGGPPEENLASLQAGRGLVYQDLYFFGHGLDFPAALRDYVSLAGPIPLLPRYALGPGFSRWYAWNEHEEMQHIIADGFASHGVPLDQLSIDMDWHPSYPRGLPNPFNVAVEGWTGYSVYPFLFPELGAFLAHAKRRGVFINLNMHPAGGFEFHEAAYPAAAAHMGLNPAKGATIAFDPANQTYAEALFSTVLRPLDDAGLDFWWIDYQHGPFSSVPLLNPTFLTNYAWWTNPWRYGLKWSGLAANNVPGGSSSIRDATRSLSGKGSPFGKAHIPHSLTPGKRLHGDRPYIYGRWGGLGGHRYPVGFAGDTAVKWRVLRYETYYSPTSSNVGFMWTHDIGGFEGAPPPELITRWVQWGCFSALLRTHSSKLSPGRSLWSFPNPYLSTMRAFYRLRARLMPYIARTQRESHESGLQILRPMYYEHPHAPAVYADQGLHQFYWGTDVWVAPIAAPAARDGASYSTGTALRFQKESQMAASGGNTAARKQLEGDEAKVPIANATLSQRNGLTAWTVWVPPGTWIEWVSWGAVHGSTTPASPEAASAAAAAAASGGSSATSSAGAGSFIARNYSLSEVPAFSRPGTILPLRTLPDAAAATIGRARDARSSVDGATPGDGSLGAPPPQGGGTTLLGLAGQPYADLTLWVLPLTPDAGLSSSTPVERMTRLYEDDGLSTAAEEEGAFAWSNIRCMWSRTATGILSGLFSAGSSSDSLTCTVAAPVAGPGGLAGVPEARAFQWRFIGSWPPSEVIVDGVSITRDQPASPDAAGDHAGWLPNSNAWAYHGPTLSTWVRIGVPVSTAPPPSADSAAPVHTVTLRFSAGVLIDDALLTSGYARTLARSLVCKDEVDRGYSLVYPSDVEPLLNISAAATRLSAARDAGVARGVLSRVSMHVRDALALIDTWRIPATAPSGYAMQHRCLGALLDANEAYPPTPLAPTDPRVLLAMSPITFTSNIESGKGSAPGQISQYSSTPGQDEATAEEGMDYYPHLYRPEAVVQKLDLNEGNIPALFEVCLPLIREGFVDIIDDSFSRCFKSKPIPRWNWNCYLAPAYVTGVALRYGVLFPLRALCLLLGFVLMGITFPIVKLVGLIADMRAWEIYLVQLLASVFVASWSGVVRIHGIRPAPRKDEAAGVFVANHSSMIDFIILLQSHPYAVVGQKHSGWVGFLQDTILASLSSVWFDRAETSDKKGAAERLKAHVRNPANAGTPALIFPEGTCVNNEYVVQFKKFVFELGVPINPIAIKYNKVFVDGYWNSRQESFAAHLFRLMTSWAVVVDIWFLDPQTRREGETGAAFASRVQRMVAARAGLKAVEWDGYMKYWKPSETFLHTRQRIVAAGLSAKLGIRDSDNGISVGPPYDTSVAP